MTEKRWLIKFAIVLLLLAVALHLLHYAIFRDAHHVLIYLVGDIAFVPLEVLLVTLVLHQLLERQEKSSRLHKLNMVIGAFFSEVGAELLGRIHRLVRREDPDDAIRVSNEWTGRDYAEAVRRVDRMDVQVALNASAAQQLRDLLKDKRDFLLRLLENPNLLEHEAFTDALWAVLHLGEELSARGDFAGLPDTDLRHLSGDVRRAYERLLRQWLMYMSHLRVDYPYLYSLAIRLNPLEAEVSPVVR